MKGLLRVAGVLVAGAGIGAGIVGGVTASLLNSPRRQQPLYTFTPFEVGASAEDVAFTSADGVNLAGWWFDQPDAPIVVICCHGHRGNKADLLGIGPGLWRAGHSVLLFDFRGNGESGDGPQSLAHHEQQDLAAAVELVRRRRPDARIAVVAFSMGAAAAILAAADDPRIEAVVADSPFTTLSEVVKAAYRRHRLPSTPLVPVASLASWLRHGYAFADVRPIDRIGALSPRPLLLLHGTEDKVIPHAHAVQLAAAAAPGPVELVDFEGAEHCGGYFQDRSAYIALVADFLDRHLGGHR